LTALASFEVEPQAAPTMLTFSLKLPVATVLILADERVGGEVWEDIHRALRLDVKRPPWRSMITESKQQLAKHLQGTNGGIYFVLKNVEFAFSSSGGGSSVSHQSLEMHSIDMGVFLGISSTNRAGITKIQFWKYKVIRASADKDLIEKVSVRKSSGGTNTVSSEGKSDHSPRKPPSHAQEDMGPLAPIVHSSHMLYVSAHLLEFGKRKYKMHCKSIILQFNIIVYICRYRTKGI
jgi:hypothetical protein